MAEPDSPGLARRIVPSLATFLAGTGALFLADFLIGRFLPSETVAEWALLKSVLFPLAAISLFGMDQMVVREPSKWRMLRPAILGQLVLLALAGSIAASLLGFSDSMWLLLAAILGLAFCNLFFGLFRANLSFTWAQVARDGWKLLFLGGIVFAIFSGHAAVGLIAAAALVVGAFLSFAAFGQMKSRNVKEIFDEVSGYKSALSVAAPFALVAIALSIASFGEVAVLKLLGEEGMIADYFITSLCFVSAIVIFNTYIATFLGSMVRQNDEKAVQYIDRYLLPGMAAVLFLPFLAFAAGWIIQTLIFPDRPIRYEWAIFMAATAGLRLAYTFISISVGALGDRSEITRIALQYFLLALLFPLAAYALSRVTSDAGMAVAAAATLHWLARALAGLRLSRKIVSRYRRQGAMG